MFCITIKKSSCDNLFLRYCKNIANFQTLDTKELNIHQWIANYKFIFFKKNMRWFSFTLETTKFRFCCIPSPQHKIYTNIYTTIYTRIQLAHLTVYKSFLYINESRTFNGLSSNLTANTDRKWTNQLLSLWNHYWDLCFSDDFGGNRTSPHRSNSLKIRREFWIKQIWICIYIYFSFSDFRLYCTKDYKRKQILQNLNLLL